jgi:DNA-directed RNA polymerase specialized sigma24 family protein
MGLDLNRSDGELLRATLSGDGEAFAAFYRRKLALEPEALDDADLVRVDELASGRGVLALVDELPDRQRTAVRARIVDEPDYADIAAELRCSEKVVRQQVSRGLSRLKGRLREDKP